MKLLPLSVLLVAVLGFGCASEKKPATAFQPVPPPSTGLPGVHPQPPDIAEKPAHPPEPSPKQTKEANKKAEKAEKKKAREEKIIVTPDLGLRGKVATYNDAGKFVVLTFVLNQMPKADAQLFVYRNNLKVGEVKITGPQRDDNIVADLVTGEAQTGDEVRDK